MNKYPALSYTAIKLYETCPYRFYQEKILKTVPYVQSEAAALGDRVHKEFENYINQGPSYTLSAEAQPYKRLIHGLWEKPGDKYVEKKMALDWEARQVAYFKGKNIWVRGQFDYMTVNDDYGSMVDYKTGSNRYPDVGQLELMSLLAFLHFPKLNYIKGSLLFIKHNTLVQAEFTRDKMPTYIETWKRRSIPIIQSVEKREWPAKRNNLCGWCPIKDCRYHPSMTGEANEKAS